MCGRFTRKENFHQLAKLLGLQAIPQFPPRFNIAPSQLIDCVRGNPVSLTLECIQLKWGLVPSWVKDPSIGHKMINARAETVADKPAFRMAFRRQRCLILADGFYEWKREGKVKQPYFIHFRDDRPFAFAGLWESWGREGSVALESCSIITTSANTLMNSIHHRMPVILKSDDYAVWLDPSIQHAGQLAQVLCPYPSLGMEAYRVSHTVNNPRYDEQQCIVPKV